MGSILGFILLCFLYFLKTMYSICEWQVHVPFLSKFMFVFYWGTFCCQEAPSLLIQTISLCTGKFESQAAKLQAAMPCAACHRTVTQHHSTAAPFWPSQTLCPLNECEFCFLFACYLPKTLFLQKVLHCLYSAKHTCKCDYAFLSVFWWFPCMQSYLLSAILAFLQQLASLSTQYYIWSNLSWFFYWIFLLIPDIFTACYFTNIR